VLNRIDQLIKLKPKKIFLMIGVNDLVSERPINMIVDTYTQIINKIYTALPSTKIFIQSVLPVSDSFKCCGAGEINEEIIILNEKLKALASNNHLIYLDIHPHFLDCQGKLDKKYSKDGLHLLKYGYLVWKIMIEKYVNE
jgi:lysophospholipase L1-like esterase